MAMIVTGRSHSGGHMLFLIVLVIMTALVLIAYKVEKTSVIMCNSFSCAFNKIGKCARGEIAIYDNAVKGLCLYHTNPMEERIIEPLKKMNLIETHGRETKVLTDELAKIQKSMKDEELLKNPNAFARWLKKQGIGKQR